jgi:hypothetical protein
MALVKCKQCGRDVPSAAPTCPNCGVPEPGVYEYCFLSIYRKSQPFGITIGMHIYVNHQYVRKLWNEEMVEIKIPPGAVVLGIRATLFPSTEVTLKLEEGRRYRVDAKWNFLGATLQLHDA